MILTSIIYSGHFWQIVRSPNTFVDTPPAEIFRSRKSAVRGDYYLSCPLPYCVIYRDIDSGRVRRVVTLYSMFSMVIIITVVSSVETIGTTIFSTEPNQRDKMARSTTIIATIFIVGVILIALYTVTIFVNVLMFKIRSCTSQLKRVTFDYQWVN